MISHKLVWTFHRVVLFWIKKNRGFFFKFLIKCISCEGFFENNYSNNLHITMFDTDFPYITLLFELSNKQRRLASLLAPASNKK